jgi:excisionase family DNA binding protein
MPPDHANIDEGPLAPDPIQTVPEAARTAKVSVRHLQSLIASGRLPVVRLGRRVLIRRESLLRFLASIERAEGGAK